MVEPIDMVPFDPNIILEQMTKIYVQKHDPTYNDLQKIDHFIDANLSQLNLSSIKKLGDVVKEVSKTVNSPSLKSISFKINQIIKEKKGIVKESLPAPSLQRGALENAYRTSVVAAERGDPEAKIQLIQVYIDTWANDTNVSRKNSFGHFLFNQFNLSRVTENDLFGVYGVAECYKNGIGVQKDLEAAILFSHGILNATEQGKDQASRSLYRAADHLVEKILREGKINVSS